MNKLTKTDPDFKEFGDLKLKEQDLTVLQASMLSESINTHPTDHAMVGLLYSTTVTHWLIQLFSLSPHASF